MSSQTFARIGLLSDSHGDGVVTRRAVELLLGHGVQALLHLGDIETDSVVDAMAVGERAEAHLVFGNCDWDAAALATYARGLGIHVDDPAGSLLTPRGELAFCHGHRRGDYKAALERGASYLCHGHTHLQTDRREGATRIVNPGALHRAAAYTVAVLDAERDEVAFHVVPRR